MALSQREQDTKECGRDARAPRLALPAPYKLSRYLTSVRTLKPVPPLGMYELSLSAKAGPAMSKLVEAWDGFIRQAMLAVGYRAATVVSFVGCPASNISRVLQKEGMAR